MKHLVLRATLLAVLLPTLRAQTAGGTTPPGALRQMNDSFADVFEKVAPAVVVIESKGSGQVAIPGLPRGLEFFLQTPDGQPVGERPNVGTGFLFRPEGYILTNFHVVENGGEVSVKMHDGRKFPATVIGGDARSDIAVLKIEGDRFPVAALGDSDAVRVGEFAFAIGTPMELPYTFTVGVVSAKGRNLQIGGGYEFLQTDASINPGNSGGPLCDIEGRVIGINALISGMNRGLGFSIPINTARDIAGQLIDKGHVVRPWLGIGIAGIEESPYLQRLFPDVPRGVVVSKIEEGAPVESSDLQAGDVILKVDGTEVALASDLQREILAKKIGQKVRLDVWRRGRMARMDVQTGEQPNPLVRVSTRPQKRHAKNSADAPITQQPSTPGFAYQDITKEELDKLGARRQAIGGVIVTQVESGSPADAAGITVGDIITEAAGTPLQGAKQLGKILETQDTDRGILLLIERGDRRTFAILKP